MTTTTKKVRFARYTEEESAAVDRIVARARRMCAGMGVQIDERSLRTDLAATHASRPLRLGELADADDFDLSHDVFGIVRHMDRNTGELRNCFVPRFTERTGR